MRIVGVNNYQEQKQNMNFNGRMVRVWIKDNPVKIFLPEEILSGIHETTLKGTYHSRLPEKKGFWVKCKDGVSDVFLALKIRDTKTNEASRILAEAKSPNSSGEALDLSECVEEIINYKDIDLSGGLQRC